MTVRSSRLRWVIPAGIAVAAIGGSIALPAIGANAAPALPAISAKTLLARTMSADVQNFSGTVKTRTDLGVPALPEQANTGSGDLGSLLTSPGTFRIARSGNDKQRVAMLGSNSEHDWIHNGRDAWSYDRSAHKAVHTRLPADAKGHAPDGGQATSPDKIAQQVLAGIGQDTKVTVGRAGTVAGRSAYVLVLSPRSSGSLIGSIQLSVDSKTYLPLAFEVLPRGSADPAIDVAYTDISYATPAASTFRFSPPAGTKVTEKALPARGKADHTRKSHSRHADPGGRGDHGAFSWTKVAKVGNVSGAKGDAGAYLRTLKRAGTPVSGSYGSGTLIRTTLVTVLVLDDGRAYAGAVTPKLVEAAASK